MYDEVILLFYVLFLCLTLATSGREQTVVRLVSPDHPRPEKDRGRSAYVPMFYYNPIVTLAKSRRKTYQEDEENYPTRAQNYAKNLFKTTPGGV